MKSLMVFGLSVVLAGCAGPLAQVPVMPRGEARTVSGEQTVLLTNHGPGEITSATLTVEGGTLVAPLGTFSLPVSTDLGVVAVVRASTGATVVVHGFRVTDQGLVRWTERFSVN